ncbi:MAG: hypothetical protein M5U26_05830 [Planctomycetota bacterium]|nr:hypothetical protein [Planctomycetota bacterium]
MSKAILVLVVMFVAGLGTVLYLAGKRWFGNEKNPDDLAAPAEPGTVDRKVEGWVDSAKQAGNTALKQAERGVKKLERAAEEALDSKYDVKFEPNPVTLKPGEKAEAKAIRTGDNGQALTLLMLPSKNSGLTVQPVVFKAGAAEAALVVEAAPDAKSALLTLHYKHFNFILAVEVKAE